MGRTHLALAAEAPLRRDEGRMERTVNGLQTGNGLRTADWVLRCSVLALVCVAASRRLSAQTQTADALWTAGKYPEAKAAYEQLLVGDVANVRANYRLGILLSWDNKLDSALVMIRRARQEDHQDVDLELAEARILAWAGRTAAAVAHYDSILARAPEKREAWLGKGLALGWAGRYDEADAAY